MMPEEWVIWGYRLFLGREPENSSVVRYYCGEDFSPQTLRRQLLASSEFLALGLVNAPGSAEDADLRHLKQEFAVPGLAPRDGSFTDFLGVRTRCDYLPSDYAQYSGAVERADGSGTVPLHEPAETVALLRSVKEAEGSFTIVELGAGWGPWLVAGAVASRQRGIEARLVGVEGDEAHFGFMRTHLQDNGIDPDRRHILRRAVVGAVDGVARFPVLPEPSADWGARAMFDGAAASPSPEATKFVEVPSVSVGTLLAELDRVQHMHCDIQGEEADALAASADALDAKVLRLVVGTHGRGIEDRLFSLFSGLGWTLEYEKPCNFRTGTAGMALQNDGVQVWRNTRLT